MNESGPDSTRNPSMLSVRTLPPSRSVASTSVVGMPARPSVYAAVRPVIPPPTTKTVIVGAPDSLLGGAAQRRDERAERIRLEEVARPGVCPSPRPTAHPDVLAAAAATLVRRHVAQTREHEVLPIELDDVVGAGVAGPNGEEPGRMHRPVKGDEHDPVAVADAEAASDGC